MSERDIDSGDTAPGDEAAEGEEFAGGTSGYLVGLGLAALLTCAAFAMVNLPLVWRPAIPMALVVLAIAQMGIHLVFFLHVSSGPDNTNNVLALAFGALVVLLLIGGSVWILGHLDHAMMPMDRQMHGFP